LLLISQFDRVSHMNY